MRTQASKQVDPRVFADKIVEIGDNFTKRAEKVLKYCGVSNRKIEVCNPIQKNHVINLKPDSDLIRRFAGNYGVNIEIPEHKQKVWGKFDKVVGED